MSTMTRSAETTVQCGACGHIAAISARAADLSGKVLVCTHCGQRQCINLAQIIKAVYDEDAVRK
jgi:transcription elongation factor Elf1